MADVQPTFDRSNVTNGKALCVVPRATTPTGAVDPSISQCLAEIKQQLDEKKVVDRDEIWGCDESGTSIRRVIFTCDDGSTSIQDFINGVPQVTQSASFNATTQKTDVETKIAYATNVDNTSPQFGRIVELVRNTPFVDGVMDPTGVKYWDMSQQPPADLTNTVTVAPFQISHAPIRKQLGKELVAVTGAAATALPNIPAATQHVQVYIDFPDANIRWTTDGSNPADNNGEQEQSGTTIDLYDVDQIQGFRAIAMDGQGNIDATLTANLTVTYFNIHENED